MNNTGFANPVSFACPKCKNPLSSADNALYRSECNQTYPIENGIPDFLSGDEQADVAPVFGGTSGTTTLKQMAKRMDFFAPVYESRLFVSTLLKLSGISGKQLKVHWQDRKFPLQDHVGHKWICA